MAIAGNDQISLTYLADTRRLSVARVFLSTIAIVVLALSPVRLNLGGPDLEANAVSVSNFSGSSLFSYSQAEAADRRGGRSGDRSGRGGGKGADRRGGDRNDTPGSADSASSSGRSGSSSSAGRSSADSDNASQSAETAEAGTQGANEGGRDAAESEGGDRSPRSWFSIDASDMDTLNVGVIASRMGKAPSDPMPELCAAHVCHDVR